MTERFSTKTLSFSGSMATPSESDSVCRSPSMTARTASGFGGWSGAAAAMPCAIAAANCCRTASGMRPGNASSPMV
jgi:hypothetical protein